MKVKEIWKKTRSLAAPLARVKYKKYIVVLALGVLIVGFLGENSVVAHMRNKTRKSELQREIDHNVAITKSNQEQLDRLNNDPKAVEKVGRERYFMKEDDEDVFVLSDDLPATELIGYDETVE